MYQVSLSGMRFHAPIGLYAEEQVLKNNIEIFLSISTQEFDANNIIDYQKIYSIVKKEVEVKETLLENLIQRIVRQITILLGQDMKLSVKIRKYAPPVGGDVDFAEVVWSN